MKVKDIMTPEPATCTPQTTMAAVADVMWQHDCGILPVVDDGKLLGVVTDRDMYIALATRNTRPSQLRIADLALKAVATCTPEDDVHVALATMKHARVRRLPVVGFGDVVVGIVSMNDIVLAAGAEEAVRNEEVVDALQAICAHHLPAPHVVAA